MKAVALFEKKDGNTYCKKELFWVGVEAGPYFVGVEPNIEREVTHYSCKKLQK